MINLTLGHASRDEEDVASVNGDEVMVRGGDDGRKVVWRRRLVLSVKEVIANRSRYDGFPVLLQEDVTVELNLV